jgi:hypothetical protein
MSIVVIGIAFPGGCTMALALSGAVLKAVCAVIRMDHRGTKQ